MSQFRQLFLSGLLVFFTGQAIADNKDYFDMSLEELMSIQVTSASKKTQSLLDAPAAIFVINQEDIKRSGATSIPEALRLAPGLEVSRIDPGKWAISARGFNGRFANKLLVLTDGRTLYTQAFSGVYWENQDLVLEDIDHIEIIRGPGAALWGANAVNGVINIITKHSADTKGGLLTGGGGITEHGFASLRYGTQIGKDTTARAYFKGVERGSFNLLNSKAGDGNFNNLQGGFRIDSQPTPDDSWTISGDAYTSEMRENLSFADPSTPTLSRDVTDTTRASGGNIRSNYTHKLSPDSNYSLQFFYDIYRREQPFDFETRKTVDIEFQHNFKANADHEIAWGLSYRYMDAIHSFPLPNIFNLTNPNPQNHYASLFLRDEITLLDDELWLTLGSKLEHNDFTGIEAQPTARLLWAPDEQNRLWGAISRAVRTPSIIDDSLRLLGRFAPPETIPNTPLPVGTVVTGNRNFKAEELLAFELGYRLTLAKALSLDATAFYNDYESLRSFNLGNPALNGAAIELPLIVNNEGDGHTVGFETSLVWQMRDWWRWDLTYSYLSTHFKTNPLFTEAQSPQHKTSIRAVINPWHNINLDFWLRYVDESSFFTVAGTQIVPSYVTMDLRLAWKPIKNIELSVVGQNLLDSQHLEAIGEAFQKPTEVPRGVYGKLALEF